MSLEWARARALQNEARIRERAKSAGRMGWPEAQVSAPMVTVWVEPMHAHQKVPATDTPAANQERLLEVATSQIHEQRKLL
jgi:hypothetical protein